MTTCPDTQFRFGAGCFVPSPQRTLNGNEFAAGILAGVISTLLVSAAIAIIRQLRRDHLELTYQGDGRAQLTNTRWFPTVIGGTWMFENGPVLYRADGFRGGESGFYLKPFGSMMVGTNFFLPGQTAIISYKHASLIPRWFSQEKQFELETWECDPANHLGPPEKAPKGWHFQDLNFKSR